MRIFLILVLISNVAFANSDSTVVIKTIIYCDHCQECSSCSGKLQHDLSFTKGIKKITLDEKAMTVSVNFNPKKTNSYNIRKAISDMGFDADSIKADSIAVTKLDECCQQKR
jgi:hypothetical protein